MQVEFALPAAGYNCLSHGLGVEYVQEDGYYWSATEPDGSDDEYNAYFFYFDSNSMIFNYNYRIQGRSVRLVKDL